MGADSGKYTHYFPFVDRWVLLQDQYFVGSKKIVRFCQKYYSQEFDI